MRKIKSEDLYPIRLKGGSSIVNYPLQISIAKKGIVRLKPQLKYEDIKKSLNLNSENIPTTRRVIYIHIPFCDSICAFCRFNRMLKKDEIVDRYLEALKKEILYYSEMKYIHASSFDALYFGGGTPSSLSSDLLLDILTFTKEKLPLKNSAEITIEGSPSNFDEEKLIKVQKLGVNRLSFGLQTFNSRRAEILNLPQTPEFAVYRLKQAEEIGYNNIDIDIMYNYPGQDISDLEREIDRSLSLSLGHLSWYPINIYKDTPLGKLITKGELSPRNNGEMETEMYLLILSKMKDAGYIQRTLTSYSKPDKSNIYNVMRSNGIDDVLSIGPGVHGYLNSCIYKNVRNIFEYIETINEGKYPWDNAACLSREERMRSFMIKGLRSNRISTKEFFNLYKVYPEEIFTQTIDSLKERELIELDSEEIRLTTIGNIWGLNVCCEFLPEDLKKLCLMES